MCMRVHESRQDHLARGVKRFSAFVGELIGRAGPFDRAISNGYSAVLDDAQFAKFRASPRACRPCDGDQLACMNDVEVHRIKTGVTTKGTKGTKNHFEPFVPLVVTP